LLKYVFLVLGLAVTVFGWLKRKKAKAAAEQAGTKAKKGPTFLFCVGLWLTLGALAKVLAPNAEKRSFNVEIFASRVDICGFSVSQTVVTSWVIIAVIFVLCILIRCLVVPKMTDVPHGLQNVLEIAVEFVTKFSNETSGPLGENLPAYIFSLCLFMIGCAAVELFGVRAPTSDIMLTASLALITFFLINFYGIKKKGVVGRIKSLSAASPIAAPFKLISDLAFPISLACRLFGNMLAGMIVMDLIYTVLGNFSFGIPSMLGLYFNLFHPFIQIYIFGTLTLTFINEAVE